MKKCIRFLLFSFLLCLLTLQLCACSFSAVARDLGNYWLAVPEATEPPSTEPTPTKPASTEAPSSQSPNPPSTVSIAGEYTIFSVTMDGITVDKDLLEQALEYYDLESKELICLELRSDGTGLLTGTDPETMEKLEVEMGWDSQWIWSLDDPTDRIAYTYSNDQISLSADGATFILQKTVLSL